MNFLWPTANANKEAKANTYQRKERERADERERKSERETQTNMRGKKTNYIFVEDKFFFRFMQKVHAKVEEFAS